MSQSWEAYIAKNLALRDTREKNHKKKIQEARGQEKRQKMSDGALVKKLDLKSDELRGLAKERVRKVLRAIVAAEESLAACEKALAKAPRGWGSIETSAEDAVAREAAE